jgi:hypothetical protein
MIAVTTGSRLSNSPSAATAPLKRPAARLGLDRNRSSGCRLHEAVLAALQRRADCAFDTSKRTRLVAGNESNRVAEFLSARRASDSM